MRDVILKRPAIDEDIIEEYRDELAKERAKQLVHGGLECGRGIVEAERHYLVFVMTLVCSECGFGDVFLPHADLVEPLAEVELRKPRGATQLVEELVNGGHGKPIAHSNSV